MRVISRILIPFLLLCMLACALPAGAEEATCVIALSGSTLTKGDALTVTVTFAADSVGAVDAVMTYDAALLKFESGDSASGEGGVVRISGYADSQVARLQYRLKFTALAAGSCRITVTNSTVYSWDEAPVGNPTAGVTVTVQDKTLSANADLKGITLSAGRLTPGFSAGNTVYTVTVENNVTSLNISAVPADEEAKVAISGRASLKVGANVRTVTVTAPAGNTKTYTVTVTRKAAPATTTPRPTATGPQAPTATQPPREPISFNWQGTEYRVGDPTAYPMPAGFQVAGTLTYGGEELPCALSDSGAVALLYLIDGEENGNWYFFRESAELLAPYEEAAVYGRSYILLPSVEAPAADMQPVTGLVAGKTWEGWQRPDSPFLYVYAVSPAGEIGWYAWDGEEETLQRMQWRADPTGEPVSTTAQATTATTAQPAQVTTAPAPVSAPGERPWLPWGVAGALGLTAAGLAVALILQRRTPAPKQAPRH